jgi:hypothetical protein
MNHRIAILAFSLGLAASPAAFADNGGKQPEKKAPKAMKMSDAQLDKVAAGALINANVVDVVDVRNVDVAVAIPVNAAVAANVLGGPTGAASLQQPGRILQ